MSGLFLGLLSFFLHAMVLKAALGMMGQPAEQNRYRTALGVSLVLNVSWFVLQILPFFLTWIAYGVFWLAVIMGVYKIGFRKSLGVAATAVVLRLLLKIILTIIGIGAA